MNIAVGSWCASAIRRRQRLKPLCRSCPIASIRKIWPLPYRRWTSSKYDVALSGSPHRWGDYEAGEKIDHVDGMTLEEAEHQTATRLYQNTAKVHFNLHTESKGRFGKRIVYGGVVISLVRALSYNGLGNAFHLAAINGGRHVAPTFAGDTIYAWSEILEKAEIPGRKDVGALRVRMVGVKNLDCSVAAAEGRQRRICRGRRLRSRHLACLAALRRRL